MTARRFPVIVRRGSISVRVYRLTRGDGRVIFTVAWHDAERRRTQQFNDYNSAHSEATLKAEQLAAGRIEAVDMTRSDRDTLQAALRIVGEVPLLAALEEWKAARTLTNGELVAAAESWAKRNPNAFEPLTTEQVIARFLSAKSRAGYSIEDNQGSIFQALKESPIGPQVMRTISATALQAYLDNLKSRQKDGQVVAAPASTKNTHRKRIITLWRWARDADILPRDIQTEAERIHSFKEDRQEIGIIDAATLRRWLEVLREVSPDDIPALVLSAFCGMRRNEVHGQAWESINLEEGHLHVNAAKEGTPANRLVPLCLAAREWLRVGNDRKGAVCAGVAVDRVRRVGRVAGLHLPENCTRHSWISYRLAETKDIAAVALEAGNSPQIIRKHYLKLRTERQAQEWFSIRPVDTEWKGGDHA